MANAPFSSTSTESIKQNRARTFNDKTRDWNTFIEVVRMYV